LINEPSCPEPSSRKSEKPHHKTIMVSRAVLLIGAITHARKEWEALASKLKLEVSEPRLGGISRRTVSDGLLTAMVVKVYAEGGSREDFLKKVKRGEYDDVVAIYRSNESTTVSVIS